jgi:hypothetical protein
MTFLKSRYGIGADLAPMNIGGTSEVPDGYREPRMSENVVSALRTMRL